MSTLTSPRASSPTRRRGCTPRGGQLGGFLRLDVVTPEPREEHFGILLHLAELAVQVRVSSKIHYDLKPEYKDHT